MSDLLLLLPLVRQVVTKICLEGVLNSFLYESISVDPCEQFVQELVESPLKQTLREFSPCCKEGVKAAGAVPYIVFIIVSPSAPFRSVLNSRLTYGNARSP
jgi:hypothetical protein